MKVKQRRNKYVFSLFLNTDSDEADVTSLGRPFHTFAPATGKALTTCDVDVCRCSVYTEYADSSFYDDQSEAYPTVEQQMRMARRVAQSLTAPANRHTRGQRMFMKRNERSVHWTVDDTNRPVLVDTFSWASAHRGKWGQLAPLENG